MSFIIYTVPEIYCQLVRVLELVTMDPDRLDADLRPIGSLSDPTRRHLYFFVARSPNPVSRDEAADALGMPRQTAAYHLDRLAAEGLVDIEFSRRSGRSGPGAGRPAKLYRRSGRDHEVSLPPRRPCFSQMLSTEVRATRTSPARGLGPWKMNSCSPSSDMAVSIPSASRAVPRGSSSI